MWEKEKMQVISILSFFQQYLLSCQRQLSSFWKNTLSFVNTKQKSISSFRHDFLQLIELFPYTKTSPSNLVLMPPHIILGPPGSHAFPHNTIYTKSKQWPAMTEYGLESSVRSRKSPVHVYSNSVYSKFCAIWPVCHDSNSIKCHIWYESERSPKGTQLA